MHFDALIMAAVADELRVPPSPPKLALSKAEGLGRMGGGRVQKVLLLDDLSGFSIPT